MKIAIVGQGAIGSLLAYYYQQESPTLLVRDDNKVYKKILTQQGFLVELDCPILNVTQDNMSDKSSYDFDVIIIPIKGYHMGTLITQLLPWVPLSTRLVLIQNGMGGAQLLAAAFPEHLIYTGTTTDAVFRVNDESYQITATGKLDIGPLWLMSSCNWYTPHIADHRHEEMWAKTFISRHPNAEYHQDIALALYTKLAINAVINPLTATLNIKNGQLSKFPEKLERLKAEIFKVYDSANISYSKNTLAQAIDKVILSTSNNWSSMQQDVEYHRQTENDTVLGYLLRLAAQHDIKTPLMKKLYLQLKKYDQ